MNAAVRMWIVASALGAFVGCGGREPVDGATVDALRSNDPSVVPTWQLEDVQPQSPRTGQTYGLEAFSGRIVVVTLVEGF